MFKLYIRQQDNRLLKTLMGLLCLIFPFLLLIYWTFYQLQDTLIWTGKQCFISSCFVGVGLVSSFVLFAGRLRFWMPTLTLIAIQWVGQFFLSRTAIGEFDYFNFYSFWLINTSLVGLGWLLGFSLHRFRAGVYLFFFGIIVLSIYGLVLKTGFTIDTFLKLIMPALFGTLWSLYTFELWRRFNFETTRVMPRYIGRWLLGGLLIGLLVCAVIYFNYQDIQVRLLEYSTQSKSSESLEKRKDGKFANKQQLGLGALNQRSNNPNPLFCAHIQLNFPDTDIPNPLYMVSYHFNRFDTLTETFERDTLFKYSDEFVPSPASLSFFQQLTDSSVLLTIDPLKQTTFIETEVYSQQLSNEAFVAPGTAFSVAPFPVDARFKSQFSSAYKAQSRVSLLNSAYWVYNAKDPMLQAFQEQRFDVLRQAGAISQLPSDFLLYYTSFPSSGIYSPFKQLADSLQRGKQTMLDKVLAVRDYFLQQRADGSMLYHYTDNPGIPGLPSASRLLYFMFESRRGYCAYYAASTVALLRLMGIPSRIVTGFMTVDRSDKNKGWYWFYEDQAHAWVQVYFPGYGWMDFDTTVGDEDARESPKPDGTPPTPPKQAAYVLNGNVVLVDTNKKGIKLHVEDAVVAQNEFHSLNDTLMLDISKAVCWQDTLRLTWRDLQPGQRISAISYKLPNATKNKPSGWQSYLNEWPQWIPIDEVYRLPKLSLRKSQETNHDAGPSFIFILKGLFLGLIFLLSLIIFLPLITYFIYKWQSRSNQQSLYPMYRRLLYVLHIAGYSIEEQSVNKMAKEQVDKHFNVQFSLWLETFWKEKYSGTTLDFDTFQKTWHDGETIEQAILHQLPKKTRRWMWFSLNRYFRYWQKINKK